MADKMYFVGKGAILTNDGFVVSGNPVDLDDLDEKTVDRLKKKGDLVPDKPVVVDGSGEVRELRARLKSLEGDNRSLKKDNKALKAENEKLADKAKEPKSKKGDK